MPDEKYLSCLKCGGLFKASIFHGDGPKRCPMCDEPSVEFHDLDRADWSAGDFFPSEAEKG